MSNINNIFRSLIKNYAIIIATPLTVFSLIECITYFTEDWLKNSLKGYWWLIYLIPTIGALIVVIRKDLINNKENNLDEETNSEISQVSSPQLQSGIRIICQRPDLPIQLFREAFEYNINGAIKEICCYVNGKNNNYVLDWEDMIFIPLQNGDNHIKIKYDISNYIINFSRVLGLRAIFDPFKLIATHEAQKSEYKEGGHVEKYINIPQAGTVKNYIYKPSPESLWAGGRLEEIQEINLR